MQRVPQIVTVADTDWEQAGQASAWSPLAKIQFAVNHEIMKLIKDPEVHSIDSIRIDRNPVQSESCQERYFAQIIITKAFSVVRENHIRWERNKGVVELSPHIQYADVLTSAVS